MRDDKTKHLTTWKGPKAITELADRIVRAQFYLTRGDLYAFWISPWKTGESRGFTAGGGPGLSGTGVDCPQK